MQLIGKKIIHSLTLQLIDDCQDLPLIIDKIEIVLKRTLRINEILIINDIISEYRSERQEIIIMKNILSLDKRLN